VVAKAFNGTKVSPIYAKDRNVQHALNDSEPKFIDMWQNYLSEYPCQTRKHFKAAYVFHVSQWQRLGVPKPGLKELAPFAFAMKDLVFPKECRYNPLKPYRKGRIK
jgi:hypothetical protein